MNPFKDLRSSVATLIVQILSIIFGILLALSLNDWRENRNNRLLAQTTLLNFREELANNRDAIEAALRAQRVFLRSFQDDKEKVQRKKTDALSLPEMNLPDVLTSAWETALSTKALAYLDYDVMMKLSELYLQQKWLTSIEDKVFQTILSPHSYEKSNRDSLAKSLYVSLKNIMEVEGRLLTLYDASLKRIEILTAK